MSKHSRTRRLPRFRVRAIEGTITAPHDVEVLDLSMRGALLEHQGMLRIGDHCFLGLANSHVPVRLQCRVVHTRVSRVEPGGILYYRTGVDFLGLSLEAEQTLQALIRSYGARKDDDAPRKAPGGRRCI